MPEIEQVHHINCIINLCSYEQWNVFMQPTGGAPHKPDTSTDATTTLTSQVIASFLSKLTENSSGDSASLLLSAIEQAPSLE
jgi:hypothetical protein